MLGLPLPTTGQVFSLRPTQMLRVLTREKDPTHPSLAGRGNPSRNPSRREPQTQQHNHTRQSRVKRMARHNVSANTVSTPKTVEIPMIHGTPEKDVTKEATTTTSIRPQPPKARRKSRLTMPYEG